MVQGFKDNPKLVSEVNLDDPFFQRREMRFVIDNEAYDIFNTMVNICHSSGKGGKERSAPLYR
jgi:hypothetical protein